MSLLVLAAALPFRLPAAEPKIEKSELWQGGHDGYAMYRIPGIVVTRKGTVLAYSEERLGHH